MKRFQYVVMVAMAVAPMVMETLAARRCYSEERKPYYYFAAKTRYEDSIQWQQSISNGTAGCRPRLAYFLIRHGSRYPSTTDYNNMIEYLPDLQKRILENGRAGNTELCRDDLIRLQRWNQVIRKDDVDDLAQTGIREMDFIAKKYQDAFPSLLKGSYNKDRYLFQSSYMERNILSAKAFAKGLFNTEEVEIQNNPKGNDSLLQFYKNCEKTTEARKQPMPEREKFIQGHITEVTIPAVEKSLGFSDGTLTFDQVDAMYKMCVFDHVIFRNSPWCAVFSRENLVTMEYLEDLRNYYLEGPGYQINIDQSCDLLKDAVKYLRIPTINTAGEHPVGVFRFTHSPVINSFLAQLGLFKGQEALLSSNMADQQDRKWRLSFLDPYSAHVAFVVDECPRLNFKLRTYVNEKLYADLDWESVMNSISDTAGYCDFNSVCSGAAVTSSYVFFMVVFVVLNKLCL